MPEVENTNTPAASTATPSATPLPDSMSQPGAAAPVMESVAPANLTMANLPAYGEPGAPEQPSTFVPAGQPVAQPAKPVKHAALLALIQGMADGLAGLSEGMASKGRVSGAEVVSGLEAQRAEQSQRAAAAAQAQKNADLQNQLTSGHINEMNVKNHILGQTWNDTVNQSHFAAQEAGMGLQKEAQEIFNTQGQVPTGWQVDPNTWQLTQVQPSAAQANAAAVGTNPPTTASAGAAPSGTPAPAQRRASILLDAYGKELQDAKGNDDPLVTQARQIINDPNAPPAQKQQALIAVQQKSGLNAQVIKNLTEKADLAVKQESAQAGARPKDLDDATGRLVQAQRDYTANKTPETKQAMDDAKVAQNEFMRVDREKKQIAQDIQNGDPDVLGASLVAGTYAPSQLLSARSMSKPFYSKVIASANNAAKAAGIPEILGPNGEHTGQYFNATKAESQYEYSKNIQTQNVLNKVRTLNEKGGDLDILKDAVTALPKLDSKTLNKMFNAGATEFGSPAATNYHMALYNVASLLANVQTGGIPTEGEIQQQLDLMNAAYSKGQLAGALQVAKRDIAARGTSMVATNPYLRAAYPDLVTTPQTENASGKAVSLAAAMALPVNKGKTADQVRADIVAHGHQVGE